MPHFRRASLVLALLLCSAPVRGEVLVRWDVDRVPAPTNLGLTALLVPAGNPAAIQNALAQGYRVYIEVQEKQTLKASALDRIAGVVVDGSLQPEERARLKRQLGARPLKVRETEGRGKWPHVRLNWVTKRDDVLQVSSRTAQPWLENNGALVRIAQTRQPDVPPLLAYPWSPITVSDVHQGPALENYLVAIAEAGSFGSDLILPLHAGFQRDLLLGKPAARAAWQEILRAIEFYAWDLPRQYRPVSNIGFVTADGMLDFEKLNLLTRHNLPFVLMTPDGLAGATAGLDVLIALDTDAAPPVEVLSDFAKGGGTVVLPGDTTGGPWRGTAPLQDTDAHASYAFGEGRVVELRKPVADPNAFALQIREVLGRDRRLVDIWNGITVLTALYQDAERATMLVSLVDYAHQPQPVQVRVRGLYTIGHFETPKQAPVLLSLQHRDGYTEFVLPALHPGGRVFLSNDITIN